MSDASHQAFMPILNTYEKRDLKAASVNKIAKLLVRTLSFACRKRMYTKIRLVIIFL